MVPNPFNLNPGDFVFICERYILAVYIYRVSIVIILKSHEEKKTTQKLLFLHRLNNIVILERSLPQINHYIYHKYFFNFITRLFNSFINP